MKLYGKLRFRHFKANRGKKSYLFPFASRIRPALRFTLRKVNNVSSRGDSK